MKRSCLAVAVALFAFACTEPYPSVKGVWRYGSTLTFPSDFNLGGGQPYVCTYQTRLTLGQSSGIFDGTYDSLAVTCNSGSSSSPAGGTVTDGNLSRGGIVSFAFDTPSWLSVGTLHGDSMGGTATDSVSGLSGMEVASGTWHACRDRACNQP